MKRLPNFDEINNLVAYAYNNELDNFQSSFLSLLINAYRDGREDAEDMLEYFLIFDVPTEALDKAVNHKTEGKTAMERVNDYLVNGGSLEEIQRVVVNECQRCYNTGAYDTANEIAKESGLVITKTWRTMMDDRVRDTHDYLEGMTVRLNERFYTWNGDAALYPRQFGVADEDINCRCVIEYGTES